MQKSEGGGGGVSLRSTQELWSGGVLRPRLRPEALKDGRPHRDAGLHDQARGAALNAHIASVTVRSYAGPPGPESPCDVERPTGAGAIRPAPAGALGRRVTTEPDAGSGR